MNSFDDILNQWRQAIGDDAFASAKPGQTLRPRTSFVEAAGQTVVQRVAPGTVAKSSMVPKQGSLGVLLEFRGLARKSRYSLGY